MDIGIHTLDEIHNILDFGFFEYEASDGDVLGDLQKHVWLGLGIVGADYGDNVPGPGVRYLDAEKVIYYVDAFLIDNVFLGIEHRGHHDHSHDHIEIISHLIG